MNEIDWTFRRAAVRLFGHGPRAMGKSAVPSHMPGGTHEETAAEFSVPTFEFVTPEAPAKANLWPLLTVREPRRSLMVVKDAGLYDDDGVIYDVRSRSAYTATLDYWKTPPHRHPALGLPRINPPRRLKGLSLFLGGLGGQTFYHFLIELLPKLALLAPLIPEASRIIVQSHIAQNKEAWLLRAGTTLPIEWLNPLDHLHCEQLAFCPPVVEHYRPNPWTVRTLRQMFSVSAIIPKPRWRHIWIDRRAATERKVSWECDLVDRLPARWEAVDLRHLSPDQILALGSECTAVAGLHGAGFANLAVWPAGVRVLEIYTRPHEPWYPCLSLSAGHEHEVAFAQTAADLPLLLARLESYVSHAA